MAGWLKRVNGSGGVEKSFNTLQKFEKTKPFCDFSDFGSKRKLKSEFNDCLEVFLKQISDISCFRPLPPVIGEGQKVDLFKLYVVVRKRIESGIVSKDEISWSFVSRDCGFDAKLGAALKLVYVKYLDKFDGWVRKLVCDIEDEKIGVGDTSFDFSSFMMKLESGLKAFVLFDLEKLKKDVDVIELSDDDNDSNVLVELSVDVNSVDPKWKDENRIVNGNVSKNQCGDDRVEDEDLVSRKRKRDCYTGMLNWIRKVAINPCHPSIGSLPQRNMWKHYGTELEWKQILLAREAMLSKMNTSQESVWQMNQQMHPSLYDDQYGSEKLRCSERLVSAKDSSCRTGERLNSELTFSDYQSDDKRIRIGLLFQADLPDFLGSNYESDSKWLGTRIWPLEIVEQKKTSFVERDPIGKGRQDSCGCQIPGSFECVRFHIKEKRIKVKLELGSAFYSWKFDGMGEEVALSWTKEEEKKFEKIVKSNRVSSEKYFWEQLFKFFSGKDRETLVSYYFNVFLLRRRGKQNRDGTLDIGSDDEESEFGPVSNRFGQIFDISPVSIFHTPKKSRLNGDEL